MDNINNIMAALNAILWHDVALWLLLGTGVTFTFWSGFSQYRALTHGTHVLRGRYDEPDDPGAINHFQALSAALSATVGLGNIGGVALAIALGGPGAVFWMWVVGFFGMAIKLTEVTLAMLYRNTDDPDNPHGGPMWVVSKGAALMNPRFAWLGKAVGAIFCITLLVSTATGGNMFQAWNVAEITHAYFGVPGIVTGIVLSILVGMVIIGGIKRIGAVAGRLVPIMVALYLLAGSYVLIVHAERLPGLLRLIVTSAFSPTEGSGAFLGGTMAYAFLFGMKRALFSNEAGQGSSPIAHSAAKTREPVREAIVAGLEPFIDTIVVCTFWHRWLRPSDRASNGATATRSSSS
jgi:AGCS family alanine or glycine:cation symporter